MGSNTRVNTYQEDGLGDRLSDLGFLLCTLDSSTCALGSADVKCRD